MKVEEVREAYDKCEKRTFPYCGWEYAMFEVNVVSWRLIREWDEYLEELRSVKGVDVCDTMGSNNRQYHVWVELDGLEMLPCAEANINKMLRMEVNRKEPYIAISPDRKPCFQPFAYFIRKVDEEVFGLDFLMSSGEYDG